MTTAFTAGSYDRFIEIKSNFSRKKLHRADQSFSFLRETFSNRDNVRVLNQFRSKGNPSFLKDDFSSRVDPSIFISIAPELFTC